MGRQVGPETFTVRNTEFSTTGTGGMVCGQCVSHGYSRTKKFIINNGVEYINKEKSTLKIIMI